MSAPETLRDALVRRFYPTDPGHVLGIEYREGRARFVAELDAMLAAARAESDALRAALTEAIAEAYCPTTAGGTEGKWCLNHDTPMVTPAICAMVEGWMAALAPSPAEGSGK